ncbi:MAG: sensor histidine kinase [Vicingaceae bacterium]
MKFYITILILLFTLQVKAKHIVFDDSDKVLNVSSLITIYEDKTNSLNFDEVLAKKFIATKEKIPNFGITNAAYWIKIDIKNNSSENNLILKLSAPLIDEITFYKSITDSTFSSIKTGENHPFSTREYEDPNFLFNLSIPHNKKKTFYLKVSSTEDIFLPITIGKKDAIFKNLKRADLLSGIYIGIMLVMILYNLFVYFLIKDTNYLHYIVYILLVLLVQTGLQGYFFQYLWPSSPNFSRYSLILFSSLVGISGMHFMNVFIKVKYYYSKVYFFSILLSILYLIPIIIPFFGHYLVSFQILNLIAGLVSLYMLIASIMVVKKGYQPANFFLIAWIFFLLGVVGFVLKNAGVLPYNNITRYAMHIGSAIETILLSFALAAKINIYKKEKEESQRKTVETLKENEKIIKNQNIFLEEKVDERTKDLNKALDNLKQAQSKLVEAEKMSSLGQLTAGIAHEINNPINFVSSNITPLRQDIEELNIILNKYSELKNNDNINEKLAEIDALKNELDFEYLKTELNQIIDGIEDGASRTIEIVDGLKNFSRLEEDNFKMADINTGIKSTLLLMKSKIDNIKIELDLGDIPELNCNPGKINQLFMNFLDNAIHAIKSLNINGKDGIIKIKTYHTESAIAIYISDNGIGITEENLSKIYDPFFTTKEIGEGTGLGLSISRGIIDAHNGIIKIKSKLKVGTEITVEFPKN